MLSAIPNKAFQVSEFIQQQNNLYALIWIPTNAQVADIGTKILGRALLDSFKELIFVKVPE